MTEAPRTPMHFQLLKLLQTARQEFKSVHLKAIKTQGVMYTRKDRLLPGTFNTGGIDQQFQSYKVTRYAKLRASTSLQKTHPWFQLQLSQFHHKFCPFP